MATDYGEKEREFLDSLAEDTGRDLAEWMRVIDAQKLSHRNDIIDWLRRQGFRFSRASWLERVHHNGGRPIYEGWVATVPRPRRSPRAAAKPATPQPVFDAAPVFEPPPAKVASPTAPPSAEIEALLAKAKAYQPLARLLIRETTKALPGARFERHDDCLVIAANRPFGALAVSARDLRLGLSLGSRPFDDVAQKAKLSLPGLPGAPAITHMVVLTDARQVNERLLDLLKTAAGEITS